MLSGEEWLHDCAYSYSTAQISQYPLYPTPNCFENEGNLQRSDPRRRRLRDKDMMSNIFAPIANLSKSEAPTTITVAGTLFHTILYERYQRYERSKWKPRSWSCCTVWYVAVTLSSLKLLIGAAQGKKTEVFLEALPEKSDKDPEPDQIPSEVLRGCNAGFARLQCCLTPQIPASHPLSPCPATILYPSDGLDPDQDTAPHVFWGVYAELEQLPRFGKGNLHLHPGPRHLPLAHLASKEVLAKRGSKVVTWRQLQWLQSLNTHQKERTAIYKWQVS